MPLAQQYQGSCPLGGLGPASHLACVFRAGAGIAETVSGELRSRLPLSEGTLAEVHCRLRLMASLAQCLNVLFNVFAAQCKRLDVVNIQLTRQEEAKAVSTLSAHALTHSATKLCRSVVATRNSSTPLSVTLNAAPCVVVSVVNGAPAAVSRPVATIKAPCTHGVPPSWGHPPMPEHPLPTHVSRLNEAALETATRHEVGSEPTHEREKGETPCAHPC